MNKRIIYASMIIAVIIFSAFYIIRNYYINVRKPIVGVIKVEGYILDSARTELWIKAAQYALDNDTIRSVVIRVDSGGGSASMCEDLYGVFKKLASKKPVVVVIEGLAASGGYYISLSGDEIYATPSSLVGNIGVIAVVPPIVIPSETIIETGVCKYTGFLINEYPCKVDEIYQNFVKAVNESRGTKLKVPLSELINGRIFLGTEAIKVGLIDKIGSYLDAVERAADMANLREYDVVDLLEVVSDGSSVQRRQENPKGKISLEYLANMTCNGVEFFYIPPQLVEFDYNPALEYISALQKRQAQKINVSGRIVIDLSHKNLFPYLVMNEFLGKLIAKGEKIFYLTSGELKDVLKEKPKALIICTPLSEYSSDDIATIKKYVDNGGKLLLLHDPGFGPFVSINTLAQEFGVMFTVGYLYNPNEKYGIYRNIIIKNFSNSTTLTKNVSSIIMFTAGAIYTHDEEVAWTSNTTSLSILYKSSVYTVIVEKNNVVAISDITFLLDPFVGLADNRIFLDNLIKWLTEKN